ncbi:MAG: protoporphyrinogen oxidase [Spirochaetia bacterium]|nr:protoporphyrinogen oxidase [Spirochaetia bacterium]
MKKIAILGAGITGLSTAYFLKKREDAPDIEIFESGQIGGQVQTEIYEDCIIEKGPETFQMRTPLLKVLCEELNISDKLKQAQKEAAKRYIIKEGQLVKLPAGPLSFLTTSAMSFFQKIKLILALKKKFSLWPGMSFFDGTRNIFGQEFAEYLSSSVARGVYGTEAEDLEFSSAFPDVYEAIQHTPSLIKAVKKIIAEKKQYWQNELGENAFEGFEKGMYSFEGGLITFVEALRNSIKEKGVKIENTKIQRVINKRNEYYVHTKQNKYGPFDKVISTVSPGELSQIIKEMNKPASVRLNEMKYSPMTVVVQAWDKNNFSYPGFGFLAPRKEKMPMLGTLFSSNIFSHKAPKHLFLTKTMISGDSDLFNDEEVSTMQYEGLKKIFKIKKPPLWYKIYRYKQGMPKYFLGYHEWKEDVLSLLSPFPEFQLSGWHFSGMGLSDALANSYKIAKNFDQNNTKNSEE